MVTARTCPATPALAARAAHQRARSRRCSSLTPAAHPRTVDVHRTRLLPGAGHQGRRRRRHHHRAAAEGRALHVAQAGAGHRARHRRWPAARRRCRCGDRLARPAAAAPGRRHGGPRLHDASCTRARSTSRSGSATRTPTGVPRSARSARRSTSCSATSPRRCTARHHSEERVRQFVADASHELRTPLAAIRGYAELTRPSRADAPPDLAHAMERVESQAIRMSSLVEDLLLLARLDSGRPLEREEVDLSLDAGRGDRRRPRRRPRPPLGPRAARGAGRRRRRRARGCTRWSSTCWPTPGPTPRPAPT